MPRAQFSLRALLLFVLFADFDDGAPAGDGIAIVTDVEGRSLAFVGNEKPTLQVTIKPTAKGNTLTLRVYTPSKPLP